MLRSVNDLESYGVSAEDGEIGTVSDFYFDDAHWTIRYLVAENGPFLDKRRVLISPIAFKSADGETERFHVALSCEKVKSSPSIDLDKPVSRQHESDYHQFYGWPNYWGYSEAWAWGAGMAPGMLAIAPRPPDEAMVRERAARAATEDHHLRSAHEVVGYHVHGSDGEIGHISDFIVDDETWAIRYLVVDTSNWWLGKKVLVVPAWASRISWDERLVYVDLLRDSIRSSPEWDPEAPVNREYESKMYNYYGRPAYWQVSAEPPAERSIGLSPAQ